MTIIDSDEMRNSDGQTEEEFLRLYDPNNYQRPSVSVDMLIFTVANGEKLNYRKLPEKILKVLMIKRGNHPFIGRWALPGGFIDINESLDAAASRRLKDEVNIDNIYMEQLYTWGEVDRDPRTRVINCSYMSLVDSTKQQIKAGHGAWDTQWFNVDARTVEMKKTMLCDGYELENLTRLELAGDDEEAGATIRTRLRMNDGVKSWRREIMESHGIAFDHALVIQCGLERLRNKIDYTDVVFHLMPEYFSLTELQQVYEVILGRELLKANFRRKIAPMVVETDRVTKDVGHRPSKLYKFNVDWALNHMD